MANQPAPTLEEFITKGDAFFSGNTVPKVELDAAKSELESARSALTASVSERDKLATALTASEKDLAAAEDLIKELEGKVAAKDAELVAEKASAKSVEELASKRAREICAAQGIQEAQLPAAVNPGEATDKATERNRLRSELATESDPKKKHQIALKIKALQ